MTSFRPRPIDIEKPLFIVREELNEEETRSVPALATGMELHEENESHIRQAIIEAQRKKTRLQANIPTPIIRIVPGYDTEDIEPWVQPHSYITVPPPVNPLFRDPLSGPTEYDIDSEDLDWIESYNENGENITEDDLELVLESFEKALARDQLITFQRTSEKNELTLDQAKSVADDLQRGYSEEFIESIYAYWISKRTRLKRPLLYSLVPPPAPDDPSPLVAFRPRDKETKKRSRKSNKLVLQQLKQLRRELEDGKTLLELVKKRERLKRDYLMLTRRAVEIRYVQKIRQPETGEGKKKGRRNLFSLEDSSAESEDSGSESDGSTTNKFSEPSSMMMWDRYPPHAHNEVYNPNGKTYWGVVRLPGMAPLRGRLRMGRGGRMFVDRVPTEPPSTEILWY